MTFFLTWLNHHQSGQKLRHSESPFTNCLYGDLESGRRLGGGGNLELGGRDWGWGEETGEHPGGGGLRFGKGQLDSEEAETQRVCENQMRGRLRGC